MIKRSFMLSEDSADAILNRDIVVVQQDSGLRGFSQNFSTKDKLTLKLLDNYETVTEKCRQV